MIDLLRPLHSLTKRPRNANLLLLAIWAAAAGICLLGSDLKRAAGQHDPHVPQVRLVDGEALYEENCASCHQSNGQGTIDIFPPLDGSRWVTGDKERLLRVLLQGLTGPVEVKGVEYNAMMPPWGSVLSDQEIAEVATYVRTSWSNDASEVTSEEVRQVRAATQERTSPWTVEELEGAPDVEDEVGLEAGAGAEEDGGLAAEAVVDKEEARDAADTAELPADDEADEEPLPGDEEPVEQDAGGAEAAVEESDQTHLYFEKVVLVDDVTRPNVLEVAPDGRVFFAEREGAVRVWDPASATTSMVGFVPVNAVHTSGLLGMALDPHFDENGWMYIYFSPHDETKNVLARFTVEDGRLNPLSKKVLLEVPVQRQVDGGHSAGEVEFGPDGNLYLSTGDNTTPRATRFAPIDERPGREIWDAQRSAGNTMDLRGKIIRIRPRPDGTYEIPEGNLFPYGSLGRPEIYVMGTRNPFRFTVDPATGWVYWGDVGPDAGSPEEGRGPAGYDEFNRATSAGNFGFPYFIGDNQAYNDFNFETEKSGPPFDPDAPVNDSPNNDGARVLPPAQPALIWYPYSESEEFPSLGTGGRSAMAGPVYRYDQAAAGLHSLPESYDGVFFIHDFMREWIKRVAIKEGEVTIEPFLSGMTFERPIDMKMGPDGRLYVIEWGSSYEGWYNDDAQIVRLDYHEATERPPVAAAAVTPEEEAEPMHFHFSADSSYSRNQDGRLTYVWDFDGDGRADAHGPSASYTYENPGRYSAHLTVTDAGGLPASDEVDVTAGNADPSVSLVWPVHGGFFDFGRPIAYRVTISDADGAVDPGRVTVQSLLLHDTHTHELGRTEGPEGSFELLPDETHLYLERHHGVVQASYTDEGGLTSRDRIVLQPRRKQAEHAASSAGIERSFTGSLRWRRNVQGFVAVEDGSYFSFAPVNLLGIDSLSFRVAPMLGGMVELRLDAPDGRLLATALVDSSAANLQLLRAEQEDEDDDDRVAQEAKDWRNVRIAVDDPGGPHELYFVFQGDEDHELMTLDWIEFKGPGIMSGEERIRSLETSQR